MQLFSCHFKTNGLFNAFPDGLVRKLKSRWCCRGDRQVKDVDFFDTCAPVVKWTTVRLLLILTAQLGLATKQVDHTTAFVHADTQTARRLQEMHLLERNFALLHARNVWFRSFMFNPLVAAASCLLNKVA